MNSIKGRIKRLIKPFFQMSLQTKRKKIGFPSCIQVQSPQDTMDACERLIKTGTRGAYLRFGDGDVNLLTGKDEKLQSANPQLTREMQEAFNMSGTGIMKCLPLHSPRFGIWPGMAPGIHGASDEWAVNLLSECYLYFVGAPIYTNIALSYLAVFEPQPAIEFLRLLKSCSPPLFIGNKNVSKEMVQKLFGTATHIPTPERNSYEEIDSIERDAMQCIQSLEEKFHVVVISMGCSGRVLAKRIYESGANVFLFDFGSLLDAFCGWDTRKWIEITPYDVTELLDKI